MKYNVAQFFYKQMVLSYLSVQFFPQILITMEQRLLFFFFSLGFLCLIDQCIDLCINWAAATHLNIKTRSKGDGSPEQEGTIFHSQSHVLCMSTYMALNNLFRQTAVRG